MGNSYQVALVNAIVTFENTLSNKQTQDSLGGDVANNLLTQQIDYSTSVLTLDSDNISAAATAGTAGNWSTSDSNEFSLQNSIYQTDSAICQTGQNNASTAVQQMQSVVSQDGTNISNAISLSNTLVQIGQFASSLLKQAYTAS
ncbi:MAG: hypothetical protein V4489_04640 [Chlamydiota bacterium]